MAIRLLQFTEYTENILCVYRNIRGFRKVFQALIALRIITELSVTVYQFLTSSFHYTCHNDTFYFYLTNGNSVFLIILGVYHSKKYHNFSIHLNCGCKFFDTDEDYLKNLKSKQSVFIAFVFVFSLVKVFLFGYLQLLHVLPVSPIVWQYACQINLLICDFRYIFEFLVLYCVLHVVSEQLMSVTRSIDNKNLLKTDSHQMIAEVDKWSVIYKHIRESSKLFNDIFGVQLTVMLTTTMAYYIIFLYTMVSQSVGGWFTILEWGVYMGTLTLMLTILCMVSWAAQTMENSADILRQRLCKLLILSISNSDSYKATRDLLRMMSTRPITARAFGSIGINMTLLPTCISFFTTYTVIALQFNNVL